MSARKPPPPPDTAGLSALSQRFSIQPEPEAAPAGSELLPLDDIAFNPLNGRRMSGARWEAQLAELISSFQDKGQVEACAVVTRAAFLGVFPEYEAKIGTARYVHATGARRHCAAQRLGWDTLRADVRDEFAAARATFTDVTGAENITRAALTAIEQATQLQTMVREHGTSQAAVARAVGKTPAWVTQQLNLLKLEREVRDALDEGELRPGQVRDWHGLTPDQQIAKLAAYRRAAGRADALTGVNEDDAGEPERRTPASRIEVAIRRLGGTPDRIAASLRAELPADQVRALAELLLHDLERP